VTLELVALRLDNDVTQFLLLPEPVHAVDDASASFQILRVLGVAAAGAARVVRRRGAVVGGTRLRHAGPRLTKLAAAEVRTVGAAVADARTWVRRRWLADAVQRPHVGAVQLSDDLLTRRRPGTPVATHGRWFSERLFLDGTVLQRRPAKRAKSVSGLLRRLDSLSTMDADI